MIVLCSSTSSAALNSEAISLSMSARIEEVTMKIEELKYSVRPNFSTGERCRNESNSNALINLRECARSVGDFVSEATTIVAARSTNYGGTQKGSDSGQHFGEQQRRRIENGSRHPRSSRMTAMITMPPVLQTSS